MLLNCGCRQKSSMQRLIKRITLALWNRTLCSLSRNNQHLFSILPSLLRATLPLKTGLIKPRMVHYRRSFRLLSIYYLTSRLLKRTQKQGNFTHIPASKALLLLYRIRQKHSTKRQTILLLRQQEQHYTLALSLISSTTNGLLAVKHVLLPLARLNCEGSKKLNTNRITS